MFSFFRRLDDRSSQFRAQAQRLDVDLGQCVIDGTLPDKAYRRAIMQCYACPFAKECKASLESGAGDVPAFCRNRPLIAGLAEGRFVCGQSGCLRG